MSLVLYICNFKGGCVERLWRSKKQKTLNQFIAFFSTGMSLMATISTSCWAVVVGPSRITTVIKVGAGKSDVARKNEHHYDKNNLMLSLLSWQTHPSLTWMVMSPDRLHTLIVYTANKSPYLMKSLWRWRQKRHCSCTLACCLDNV